MPVRAIIDASVVLKWYLDDEEHCSEAHMLRDDIVAGALDVAVPSLLVYEVANALCVAADKGRLSQADAQVILHNLLAFALPPVEGTDLVEDALSLAQTYRRSAYDAAYLSLARLLSVPLYTGDRRLYNALHDALPWVRWIGEYTPA